MKLSLPALLDAGRRYVSGHFFPASFPSLGHRAAPARPVRRAVVLAGLGLGLATVLAFPATPSYAQDWGGERWVGTWGAGPGGPPLPANTQTFTDQTVRLIVHTSIGGTRVRIRLSNEMGSTPLRIGNAHVALRATGADNGAGIQEGSDRPLTFSGNAAITIPPGAPVLSDPVDLAVPALSDLAVSLYLPGTVGATTIHGTASQTNYVSLPGDFTGAATLPTQRTILSWPFLTEVDVTGGSNGGGAAVVTLGDSITDGTRSTPDTNNRWPDWLERRLQTVRDPAGGLNARLGVVNRGISGNRLLTNPPEGSLAGRNILERFDRDVLATAGVRYMTLMIGINDIGNSSAANPLATADLIAGYRQVIARAHAKGIAVYGATLTPFEGAGYYSVEKEAIRQAVNNWIRASDEFDGVIDFDRVTRDPSHPARFLPSYDSGDHLHPNDLGYQAMGNAVPLELFRTLSAALKPAAQAGAAKAPVREVVTQ
ncbi:SGNH/GDSL hydrolase family protein [Massilia forsythiae]|uniref:SGNH/GDSL hydrolase family protein n=1 Tax=Massilia forsythiae TaxID=2728020 RepID=A0A7Z2VY28_9BURK|nr:SGNH/GDSL hydrolase family protein [Massilia forsythiae]QJE01339.1 SGNH/GDSL hydrolase family protein [Massilia forsythiae]